MVKILGAGLAGLAAAAKLASAGEKVEVFERGKRVGIRFPDSLQAIRNYESKKDKLEEYAGYGLRLKHFHPVYKIRKYAPSLEHNTTYSNGLPLFYTFKRGSESSESVDAQLAAQAEESGARIFTQKQESVKNADVIATGPLFTNGVGYETHYADADASGMIHFFSDNDYAPQGYACVLPYGKNEATVLVTSFDPLVFNRIKEYHDFIVKNNPIVQKIVEGATKKSETGGFGYYNVPKNAFIKGKYFIGEVAGFVDAARGFGADYAITSAVCAAKAIVEKTDYDVLWKNAFEAELIHSFKRRLAYQFLMNQDYEEMISREKKEVSIEEYKQKKKESNANFIETFLRNHYFSQKLKEWQKRYDLSKLIG
jgi:flavin-dependent dehydrogenase